MLDNPCSACGGAGVTKKRQRIKVTIPAGVSHGQRITIPGQGDAARGGGETGDLHVIIHIQPHKHFERENYDLYCAVPISITQAALGAEINVPTLNGKRVKVKVPSGTQNGKILRLRNEGVPVTNSPSRRGDLYIKLQVMVPSRLSGKAKALLQQVAELEGENARPDPIPLKEL